MSSSTPAIHLVYPHRPRISSPDVIGYQLGRRLAQHYLVKYYDWAELRAAKPAPGDVLLGHPHPSPLTCFRRSLSQPNWRRRLILAPYHHGDDIQVAFLDPVVARCDQFLAITGNYWFSSVAASTFAHWLPKMVHVDLALDRAAFPVLKTQFNPPGKRRFVYIGHSAWTKNPDYLSAIARAMPETPIDWIGRPLRPIPGVRSLGPMDFSSAAGREAVANYDFMLTVGKADANPATILEVMAWGLIPVCTQQSGYVNQPGIVNVPLADVPGAIAILRRLQDLPEPALREMQAVNWQALDEHYTWDRFANQVMTAIDSAACPPLGAVSLRRHWYLRWQALISPYAPWRPANFARWLAHARH